MERIGIFVVDIFYPRYLLKVVHNNPAGTVHVAGKSYHRIMPLCTRTLPLYCGTKRHIPSYSRSMPANLVPLRPARGRNYPLTIYPISALLGKLTNKRVKAPLIPAFSSHSFSLSSGKSSGVPFQ